MATSPVRRIIPKEVRRFGSVPELFESPDLTEIQTRQLRALPAGRRRAGEARRPRPRRRAARDLPDRELRQDARASSTSATSWASRATTPDECRQLRLTYGRPFRVWLRLNKEQPVEEEVYLGDMPIMIGGGEFIINGAERVVVSQLHRSPGVDFVVETRSRRAQAALLPHHPRARQLDRAQRHQEGHARRPHRPERQVLGHDAAAGDGAPSTAPTPTSSGRSTRPTTEKVVDGRSVGKIEGKIAVGDVVDPAGSDRAGEIIVEAGQKITKNAGRDDLHLAA